MSIRLLAIALTIVLAIVRAILGPTAAAAQAPTPPVIRAEDPNGSPATVLYEAGRWTLIGLTDRRHSAELADWFRGLAPTADAARARRYVVVALPRLVPPPFRGSIRGAFRRPEGGPWTYLLDWGGSQVAAVTGGGDSLPCLLLVTPERVVAGRLCGRADSVRVEAVRVRLARDVR